MPDFLSNHKWGKIVHNQEVEWLASWKDVISGKIKYVWLGAQSKFKAESDKNKFDLAKKLKRKIRGIRETINKEMTHKDQNIRQVATALYFIDNLALRVGNEKGEDEADTVGVTSLRVEHIKIIEQNVIELDFLGKDSIRYKNKVIVNDLAFKNIKEFIENKKPSDQLFDRVKANFLNEYLQTFMKDLTAKVFRTFNASYVFQKELKKITKKYKDMELDDKINTLLSEFNRANAKVAILCNHKKKVAKSFNNQLEKINQQIKKQKSMLRKAQKAKKKSKERIKKIKLRIKKLRAKKKLKIDLKSVSLETSKANYIDPRITLSFMKKHNLPIEKIFSKTLREKFWWAFNVDENYIF